MKLTAFLIVVIILLVVGAISSLGIMQSMRFRTLSRTGNTITMVYAILTIMTAVSAIAVFFTIKW